MTRKTAFERRMADIYRTARDEAGYNPTRYLQMLADHGAIETAHILLGSKNVSEGYTAIWERGRLDLTVEALVLEEDWGFFSEDQLATARKRLKRYGYFGEEG